MNKVMSDITRGGQFLIKETNCEDIFTLEDLTEEQKLMRDTVSEFVDKEIFLYYLWRIDSNFL